MPYNSSLRMDGSSSHWYVPNPFSMPYFSPFPQYTYDPVTAGWSHRNGFQLAQLSLEDISYRSGRMQYRSNRKDTLLARGEKILPVSENLNTKFYCMAFVDAQDPFREAKVMAVDALRRALTSIDYTSDPPLNVPDKYKHMVWFALPIDIALMMVKQRETGQETLCHIDSIPFIPDDAKVRKNERALVLRLEISFDSNLFLTGTIDELEQKERFDHWRWPIRAAKKATLKPSLLDISHSIEIIDQTDVFLLGKRRTRSCFYFLSCRICVFCCAVYSHIISTIILNIYLWICMCISMSSTIDTCKRWVDNISIIAHCIRDAGVKAILHSPVWTNEHEIVWFPFFAFDVKKRERVDKGEERQVWCIRCWPFAALLASI